MSNTATIFNHITAPSFNSAITPPISSTAAPTQDPNRLIDEFSIDNPLARSTPPHRQRQLLAEQELNETLNEVRAMSSQHSRLKQAANLHLLSCVTQLAHSHALSSRWVDVIVRLSVNACENIRPNSQQGDKLDIIPYVKVKRIQAGRIDECTFLTGLAFRKNVAHKRMKTAINRPRILLLSSAIEFHKDDKYLTSLDTVLEQERKYIETTVSKIVALEPNVLVVEKTVSRLAQDLIRLAGISLVLNVKPTLMHRLSRSLNCPVISLNDNFDKSAIGTCGIFHVQQFDTQSTEEAIPSEVNVFSPVNSALSTDTPPPQEFITRRSNDATTESGRLKRSHLMIFDDCALRKHGTIILRGGSLTELKHVKIVLKIAIHVAYSLSLETALLFDECSTYNLEDLNELQKDYDNMLADISSPKMNMLVNGKSLGEHKTEGSNTTETPKSFDPMALDNMKNDGYFHSGIPSAKRKPTQLAVPLSASPFVKMLPIPIPASMKAQVEDVASVPAKFITAPDNTALDINYTTGDIRRPIAWVHESILFGSCWIYANSQCFPPELKAIDFFTDSDKSLGAFLVDNCFDLKLRCLNDRCGRDVLRHTLTYTHAHGRLVIQVKRIKRKPSASPGSAALNSQFSIKNLLDNPSHNSTTTLPILPSSQSLHKSSTTSSFLSYSSDDTSTTDNTVGFLSPPSRNTQNHPLEHPTQIMMWSRCKLCNQRVTPYIPMSDQTYNLSFGKFLDLSFHSHRAVCRTGGCIHAVHPNHTRYFGLNGLMASFEYYPLQTYKISTGNPLFHTNSSKSSFVRHPSSLALSTLFSTSSVTVTDFHLFNKVAYAVYADFLRTVSELDAELNSQMHRDMLRKITENVLIERDSFTVYIESCGLPQVPTLATSLSLGSISPLSHPASPNLRSFTSTSDHASSTTSVNIDLFELNRLQVRLYQNFHMWNRTLAELSSYFFSNKQDPIPATLTTAQSLLSWINAPDKRSASPALSSKSCNLMNTQELNSNTLANIIVVEPMQFHDSPASISPISDEELHSSSMEALSIEPDLDEATESTSDVSGFMQPPPLLTTDLSASSTQLTSSSSDLISPTLSDTSLLSSPRLPNFPSEHSGTDSTLVKSSSRLSENSDVGRSDSVATSLNLSLTHSDPPALTNSSDMLHSTAAPTASALTISQELSHSNSSSLQALRFATSTPLNNALSIVSPESILTNHPHLPSKSVDFLRGLGRFNLPALAHDLCIPVHEDEHSSIIAYTLATVDHLFAVGRVRSEDLSVFYEINRQMVIQHEANMLPKSHVNSVPLPTNDDSSSNSHAMTAFDALSTLSPEEYEKYEESATAATSSPKLSPSPSPVNTTATDSCSPSAFSFPSSGQIPPHLTIKSLLCAQEETDSPERIEKALLSEDSDSLKHTFEEVSRLVSNPFNLTTNSIDRITTNFHPQLNSDRTTFFCTVYYPRQFHALRLLVCKGDYSFLQSLSRCAKWKATGGKSGSTFCKTRDDRYVLKYVKKPELKMLLDIAKHYFSYMAQSSFHNLPSMLCRIVGAYQVSWKKSKGERLNSQYIIVMPNLFYQAPTIRVFDLKGSARNRYIKRKSQDDIADAGVLLDENLLEFTGGHPIPLDDHTKTLLRLAIFNDTLFLSNMHIVDYSLVVGINEDQKVLTMGVIDYIRQYTWDKRLETAVKSTGMIAGQSLPTVISPNSYKQRFRLAMERYFAMVPNHDTKWHVELANAANSQDAQNLHPSSLHLSPDIDQPISIN